MTLADQAHFGNYDPSSFGWGDPRVTGLVPLTFNGVSFGQCARDAHPVFVALLTELVPHIEGGLHAGSCWSWTTNDELPEGGHSFHWYGTAIDVNWNVNHMGTNIPDATGEYAIPRDVATSLAKKYGCEWGGNWLGGYHDNMHFEIHLSPAVAATVQADTPAPLETEDVANIYRPSSGPYHYPVLVDGTTKVVLTDHGSVVALLAAGAKTISVAPVDFERIRAGAVK